MSLMDIFEPIYKNSALQTRGLVEKTVKIYTRFIQRKDEYLSLAVAKGGLKSITSQEIFICVAELEKMGYLIAKIDKARLVYKFNDGTERTNVSVPLSKIDAAQKLFEQKVQQKIDRAKKVLEKYSNRENLLFEKKDPLTVPASKVEDISSLPRTALEIHEQDHTGVLVEGCRLCAFEQDKAIGF